MATRQPFSQIGPYKFPVWYMGQGQYRAGLVGADVDGDGIGGRIDNDLTWQPTTSYKPNLDSTKVPWGVLPICLIRSFPGRFLGCRMVFTNTLHDVIVPGVGGDGGPDDKIGEFSIAACQGLFIPSSPRTGGTTDPIILIDWWPEVPAVVDGVTYELQSFPA